MCQICKMDHCIHMRRCISMSLGHNDTWVESHMYFNGRVKGHLWVNNFWLKFQNRITVSTCFDVFFTRVGSQYPKGTVHST